MFFFVLDRSNFVAEDFEDGLQKELENLGRCAMLLKQLSLPSTAQHNCLNGHAHFVRPTMQEEWRQGRAQAVELGAQIFSTGHGSFSRPRLLTGRK